MRLTERMRRAVLLALSAAVLAGCGVGAGEELEGDGAELRVTRDFGHELLASAQRDEVNGSDTVMRFLQDEREVETAYGGGFVQAIDGLEGQGSGGRQDWFYFVNGIEASVGSADRALFPGDVVQWDHRNWEAAMRVPAIVGAWPEPFLHGSEGERYPTRVECEDEDALACQEVKDRLTDAGVPVTGASLGSTAGPEVLRVVVATWPVAREVQSLQFIERGPDASGVFARLEAEGSELVLLDQAGDEAATLGPGSGLVAATRLGEQQPVWAVTGVDDAGVQAAADALDPDTLRDAFAVAIGPEGPVRLPVLDDETSMTSARGSIAASDAPGSTAATGAGRPAATAAG